MTSSDRSHARRNLLTGEWTLVSPQRLDRPWQGQHDKADDRALPAHDPQCFLCPGNSRANGDVNPDYSGPFAFANDFPALTRDTGTSNNDSALFQARAETGVCRVVCYTERHDQRLSTMRATEAEVAVRALVDEFAALDAKSEISYVMIFENRGEMMGCSNPHPHAQVWATAQIPTEVVKELREQRRWLEQNGSRLLLDYCTAEMKDGARIVACNEHFVALVPYWATWPFETLILPLRPVSAPTGLSSGELGSLAQILVQVLGANDRLFDTAAPYSMGWHPRPSDGQDHPEWQFHIHICPPLLRSATVRKHMVGFEMFGMPQRDISPEQAAAQLRSTIRIQH